MNQSSGASENSMQLQMQSTSFFGFGTTSNQNEGLVVHPSDLVRLASVLHPFDQLVRLQIQ